MRYLLSSILFLSFSVQVFASSNIPDSSLFVILANQGSIQAVKNNPTEYKLTLKNVNPSVISFATRPYRMSKQVNLNKFIYYWTKGSFAKVAPNAVINAIRLGSDHVKNKKSIVYTVTLNKPVYNANNNTLSFIVKPIKGNPNPLPNISHSSYIALFIDNGCMGCWMQNDA